MTDFVKVAAKQDVPSGQVKVFDVGGQNIALCNVEGSWYAILDVCTHDGAALDQGELEGCQIECPRHGARFDVRTGKAMCLPAIKPVPTYPVELRGEDVWVGISQQSSVKS